MKKTIAIIVILAVTSYAQTEITLPTLATHATGEIIVGIKLFVPSGEPLEACARHCIDENGQYGKALVSDMIDINLVNQHGQNVTYREARNLLSDLTVTHNDLVAAGQMCSPAIDYETSHGASEATVIKLAFIIRAGELLGYSGADLLTWVASVQGSLQRP